MLAIKIDMAAMEAMLPDSTAFLSRGKVPTPAAAAAIIWVRALIGSFNPVRVDPATAFFSLAVAGIAAKECIFSEYML